MYKISFARSARKELESLDSHYVQKIFSKIDALQNNPRPAMSKKLQGPYNLWRIRVADYRIVYSINDGEKSVVISLVKHRKEVYR